MKLLKADSELDSEFDDDDRDAPMELPKPKLFCIIKQAKVSSLVYDFDLRGINSDTQHIPTVYDIFRFLAYL